MVLKEVIEHKLVNRDIKRFLQSRVYKSMDSLESFDNYQVVSLKGEMAREYTRKVIELLENSFMNLSVRDELPPMIVISKLLKNFEVFKQIKSNWSIDGWERDKPTFSKLLSFDIDKKTGLINYGELKSLADHIISCKDFDKEEVNKYFRDWVENPRKLDQSDYVTLLNFSNREAMSQVDSKKLENIPSQELRLSNPEKGIVRINFYQYNPNNALEFVEIDLSSSIVNEETSGNFLGKLYRKLNKVYPLFMEKAQLKFDKKFENVFRNMVINDTDFLKRQIEEVLFRDYLINDVSDVVKKIKIISIALQTPYNKVDKDLMPEIEIPATEKENFKMIIRINDLENKNAKYIVVGA